MKSARIVLLGLGGTIAGVSHTEHETSNGGSHYLAAQLSIHHLLRVAQQAPALKSSQGFVLEAHQVAQIDSKDMGWATWRQLLVALKHHLDRPEVIGIVITHGTDTLEETAVLLHLLLPPTKPVVLTAAMRPSTSADTDGPLNLRQAIAVAYWAAKQSCYGVVAVMAGRVWASAEVRKSHSWRMDAFDAGGLEPLASFEADQIMPTKRSWPRPLNWGWQTMPAHLPRVQLLTSHADADKQAVASLLFSGAPVLRGVVLAGTGHGTLPDCWAPSLRLLHAQGVAIWRSTRVARGGVNDAHASATSPWPAAGHFTGGQARLALSLALWRCPDAVLNPPCRPSLSSLTQYPC